jgi:hypothetical protein
MDTVLQPGLRRITRSKRLHDQHQRPESTLRKKGLAKWGAVQSFISSSNPVAPLNAYGKIM